MTTVLAYTKPFETEFLIDVQSSLRPHVKPAKNLITFAEEDPFDLKENGTEMTQDSMAIQNGKSAEAMGSDLHDKMPFTTEFTTDTQSAHRYSVRPIQILVPSSTGDRFELNERGLQSILGDPSIADRKVVIISVAGAFRKGKSFLLNFFLEYLYALQKSQQNGTPLEWLGEGTQVQGFHWRSGASRDTVGMWMWGEPILIDTPSRDKLAVVLLDTQGAFDSQSTYKQCTTIFALSTIVSSLQIYNVVDAIQEDALQNLSLFVEYGRLAMEHAKHLGTPFQSLCFCVRDFKSPEEFPFGKDGGKAYMDQVLNTPPAQAAELRTTRAQIAASFADFSCYLLPHPGQRVAERRSFRGDVRDLRPEFYVEMRNMTESLLSPKALQPKKINGKQVTCKKILQYFKEYASTFDNSSIPMPMNLLQANARLLRYDAIQEAKSVYCNKMDKEMRARSILSDKKLLKIHIRCEKAALKAYENYPKITTDEAEEEKNRNEVKELIDIEFERYQRINAAKKEQSFGDTLLLGVGLGVGASSAVAGTALAVAAGIGTAGVIAVPATIAALTGAFGYVITKPRIKKRLTSRAQDNAPLLDNVRMRAIQN